MVRIRSFSCSEFTGPMFVSVSRKSFLIWKICFLAAAVMDTSREHETRHTTHEKRAEGSH